MRFERVDLTADGEAYIETYVADKVGDHTKKALLVIPGGGYGGVCSDREGEPIALAFMKYGFNAFVLHYTVGRKKPFPAQLIEASLAVRHIKENAEKYNIDPDEVFAVGFSAGGHLAGSLGILWKHEAVTAALGALGAPFGCNKPKGVMLIYPVVTSAEPGSYGSLCNLLCTDSPSSAALEAVDLEKQVDSDSVPAFIVHTTTDEVVNVRNSLALADAYSHCGRKFELHIYPDAPHGVALADRITECGNARWVDKSIAKWVEEAAEWAENPKAF